jgi:hypothetical protein
MSAMMQIDASFADLFQQGGCIPASTEESPSPQRLTSPTAFQTSELCSPTDGTSLTFACIRGTAFATKVEPTLRRSSGRKDVRYDAWVIYTQRTNCVVVDAIS